jgi:hypothetical protein
MGMAGFAGAILQGGRNLPFDKKQSLCQPSMYRANKPGRLPCQTRPKRLVL